ncbi:MAG TPA: hypothetical protein VKV28_05925 [Candidatus Binataceae bacterium]|nr:hypothetical protein [Candidatus Binataceae bacterium]
MAKHNVFRLGLLSLGVFALACASRQTAVAPPVAKTPDRYIYVTDKSLPGECFSDLGPVRIAVPYADAAVDPDLTQANRKLRAEALAKYPATDAVIEVKSHQNDVGTEVNYLGEAVELQQHPTVECAMRGAPKVVDSAALLAAGGVGGVVAAGGITAAPTVAGVEAGAAVGVAVFGAYGIAKHQTEQEARMTALRDQLERQRQQIEELIGERKRLRECQNDDLTYSECMNAKPIVQIQGPAPDDKPDPSATVATPFEMQRQIQEQSDYLKKLQGELAQLRTSLGD